MTALNFRKGHEKPSARPPAAFATDEALLLAAWGIANQSKAISYPIAGAAQHVRNVMRAVLERYAPKGPGQERSDPSAPTSGNTGIEPAKSGNTGSADLKSGNTGRQPVQPWPSDSDHNARRVGWAAYFNGEGRDACPFPPDRRDLKAKFEEGWDEASRAPQP